MKKNVKVAIVSGPTGGHFFPALSIGDALVEREIGVKFFIPERKFIIEWLKKRGYKFSIIPVVKLSKKDFFSPFKFLYTIFRCLLFLKRERYTAVVGTGSYTTFSFLLACLILRKKIYLHEQNYIPGKVTQFFSPFSYRTFLTFPSRNNLHGKKVVISGFPILKEFKEKVSRNKVLKKLSLEKNRKNIVIFGGSQSASFLNKVISSNFDYFKKNNFQIIIIAGREKKEIEKIFSEKGIKGCVFDFYYNMNELYSIADIIISRAGAGTISEINYWQIPAIVIPYPYAGGHQFFNAEFLSKKNACFLLKQKEDIIYNFPLYFEKFMENYETIKTELKKIKLFDDGEIADIISGDIYEKK